MSVAVFTSYGQQLTDAGVPLSGGSVTVYQAGTTTPITLKSASDLSGSSAANPIVLDSAGRHDMRYFANQAYKVVVKNSSGVSVYTRDNIDPGIAIGTGDVAIVDGGTGASTAPAALSNLGGATSAEVSAVAASVAALSGTLSASDKTHIATGTTAQRPASPTAGDIRCSTTTGYFEMYDGSGWANVILSNFTTLHTEDATPDPANDFLLEADSSSSTTKKLRLTSLATALNATQAQMEAASATTALVSPATQVYHVSAAKFWCKWGVTSTPDTPSHNLTSITDNGTGDWTLNIATDFSDANYVAAFGSESVNTSNASGLSTRQGGQAAGTLRVTAWSCTNAGSFGFPFDDTKNYAVCFGDLP